ncbi:40S ribosomal protein S4 (nucleomorph) [Lotharella oceanica]|uniref:40S ribosomal protein S4 n=1 Tax=Lotharella oceanica TaxID=641309 RepID=A0A060D6H0_9EUKA|nr:40S ribosomal protein S4 [Lotharella oceanica]|mmetsp:Transcript_11896/g.22913  ORF Transcript_11896/g.22913 Transcript_11896/m.22913 type:complete len:246 (-) Transcript_11896:121-858(-)
MVSGLKKHQKRISKVKQFMIEKQNGIFATKTYSGHRSSRFCIPLFYFLKKFIRYCSSIKEAKKILKTGCVFVNNRICYNYAYPIGIWDYISLPIINKFLRVFLDKDGTLKLYPIKSFEKKIKILRVRKIYIGKNNRKIIVFDDQKFYIETSNLGIKVYDSLVIRNRDLRILHILDSRIGNICMILDGNLKGKIGLIIKVIKRFSQHTIVHILLFSGLKVVKNTSQIFIIGENKRPFISLKGYFAR